MNRYPEHHRNQVKNDLAQARDNMEPVQGVGDDCDAHQGVDNAVEPELPE